MSLGAAGVICLILMRLAAGHGWAWAQGHSKQNAATTARSAAHSAFPPSMVLAFILRAI
jgi:hypothetical protein